MVSASLRGQFEYLDEIGPQICLVLILVDFLETKYLDTGLYNFEPTQFTKLYIFLLFEAFQIYPGFLF